MTYVPVILNSDNRQSRGMAPLKLQNWYVEPISSDNTKQAKATLLPTPGLTERLDLGDTIQGVWQEDGVQDGGLFVVAGSKLYSVSASWVPTEIGTLDTGYAEFAGIRSNLFIACNTRLWRWNGSALTEVTDVDLPDVGTMIVLNQRLLLHSDDDDTQTWSDTLDGTAYEALAFSTAEQSPDPIRRIIKINGQAVVLGSTTIEIFRPVASTTLPFQNVTNSAIEETQGVIGKYGAAKSGDKVYFIGGDHAPYVIQGLAAIPIAPNFELKEVLDGLSASNRALTQCWAYRDGNHDYFVVRPVGSPAHVYDGGTKLWHTRETYNEGQWLPRFHTKAYGHNVVAYEGGTKLYTMHRDVYSDAGEPVVRTGTLRFNGASREAIGSFCLDVALFDHPESGQGSAPILMLDLSESARAMNDNGRAGIHLEAPLIGEYHKPTLYGLGLMKSSEGLLVQISVSDPVGVGLYGAWINEGQV